jgi:hypothetical protein
VFLALEVDNKQVLAALRQLDADEKHEFTRYQREILQPTLEQWRRVIPHRSGKLGGSAIVSRGQRVYIGYGPSAPVWAGVQEFGGSVPAPYSRRLTGGSRHLFRGYVRRITIKPSVAHTGRESYWLYPAFRRNESTLAPLMEAKLGELLTKHGL